MDQFHIEGHKLLWHLDRVAAWQKGEVVAPIYLEVSPVSYCNHRCIFCGVDFAMQEHHSLETEVFCERLKEMGPLGVKSIMFAGEGEPLLHPDLARMVATAKEAGIDVSITSNGSLGNRDIWEEILPHLTWIRFSVDAGTSETHARVHGVAPKVFSQTVSSIKYALAVRAARNLETTIGVQFLVLPENLDDLRQAIELFGGLGVDYIALKPFSLHPQMIKDLDVDYAQDLVDRIQAVVDETQPGCGSKIIFRRQSMTGYQASAPKFRHCHALPFWAYINSLGEVYTCSVFMGEKEFMAGSIYDQDMASIFNGPERCASLTYGSTNLDVAHKCRVNCRMARINEFLDGLASEPQHVNFI